MRAWIGVVTLISGLLILLAGLIIIFVIPQVVKHAVLKKEVVTSPSSSGYDDFVTTSNDTAPYMRLTFWNLTNAAEVISGDGARPIFVECGPYVYRRITHKQNVTFSDNGEEVTYKMLNDYTFLPEFSTGDPYTDQITTLNSPYFAAVAEAGSESLLAIEGASQAIAEIAAGVTAPLFLNSVFYTASVQAIETVFAELQIQANLSRSEAALLWASVVSAPPGYPPAFLLSNTTSSGITPTQANNLFNPATPYSLSNPNQDAWIASATNSSIIEGILVGLFGLSPTQAAMVYNWRVNIWQPFVQPQVIGAFSFYGVNTPDDLGYLQWGTGAVTMGVSIQASAGLPGIPEIGLYLESIGVTPDAAYASPSFCKSALTTFSNAEALAIALLTFEAAGSAPNGFTVNQFAQFAQYINGDIFPIFVDPLLKGGIFATDTPNNFLFGRVDPWVLKISPANANIRGIWNDWRQDLVDQQIAETYDTGKGDISRATYQITYLGQSNLTYYNPNPQVEGADGSFFGPKRIKQDDSVKLLIFSTDLEREVELLYNSTYVWKGITLYRYRLNLNYKTITVDEQYNVQYDHIINLNKAGYGFDFIVTFPHFLYSDPKLTTDKVVGMRPDPAEHELFLDVEPITGLGLKGLLALQANLYIPPFVSGEGGFDRWSITITNDTYYPWYWERIDRSIDDKDISDFKSDIYDNLNIGNIIGALLITVGILTGLIGTALVFVAVRK